MAAIAAMAIVPATDRLSLVDKTAHCFIVPSTDLPPRSKYLFVQPFPPLPSANLTQRATLWRDPGVYARPIGQKQLFAGVERHRYIVSFYATSPCLAASQSWLWWLTSDSSFRFSPHTYRANGSSILTMNRSRNQKECWQSLRKVQLSLHFC